LLPENTLKSLGLLATDLLPQSSETLAEGLVPNAKLREIKLADNFIGESGAMHIAHLSGAHSLTTH